MPSHRPLPAAVPLLVALCCVATGAVAQAPAASPAGRYARIVVILPKPGQDSAFEAGYQRHLSWHRTHRDPWTWRGWSFVLGDRLDAFLDGTFGHELADFDHAVDPAGDGADNRVNVEPYASFLSHGVYERIDSLGAGAPLPDDSPWLALTTFTLVPGQAAAFERLVGPASSAMPAGSRFTWYRLVRGGEAPTYLLLQPAVTFGAAAGLPVHSVVGSARLGDVVRSVLTEVVRYRPDMSYEPSP